MRISESLDIGSDSEHRIENNHINGLEVAVIGMAGKFPGAPDLDRFWSNLKDGVESISFFDPGELAESGVEQELIDDPGYVNAKGILGDVENFDARFFDYTAAEARLMDPQVRLFHECAWNALEDAGYDTASNPGKIGLYAGASDNFYWQALAMLSGAGRMMDHFSVYQLISKDFLSTRVSYKLNLRGPSCVVQTACSTSLVAIHMACQGLLSGECSMALAGGVSIKLPEKSGYLHSKGLVMSPDGHCRAFDAGANGFINGNGAGAVVLKLLEDALADSDHIHAVIKGSSVNNDGNQKAGYTAPSIRAQSGVIKGALQVAEVEPESIGYIETHGTGTPLGDPIEIQALTRAFDTDKKGYCRIGSVKTNIGHLDAAAGVAGFIKTILALKHKEIPPSLHFSSPNPAIDFDNSPFTVNAELIPWTSSGFPRRAGVSSFGIGGTNAHVLLEEAPEPAAAQPGGRDFLLFLFSGKTRSGLDRVTQRFRDHMALHPELNPADASYTLQMGRTPLKHRRMTLVAKDEKNTLMERLGEPSSLPAHDSEDDNQRLVFLFSGLGAQYTNMGRDLYRSEPVFREEADRCFAILDKITDLNVKQVLYPPDTAAAVGPKEDNGIDGIEAAQLAVFTLEYALAKLIMAWGVKPDAMMGYSFGEYTAACLSGVFSLEDTLNLIAARGRLLSRATGGAMVSIPLPTARAAPLLAGHEGLSIAIDNGSSCIAAGPEAAVTRLLDQLKKQKMMAVTVPHSVAMHTPMMAPLLDEFRRELEKISFHPPEIPYISNLTGQWIDEAEAGTPGYWCRHLSHTVRFAEGMTILAQHPASIFIEIGPGRELSTMVKRFLDKENGKKVLNLVRPAQKETPDTRHLLQQMGRLWLLGREIDWDAFYRQEKRQRVPLPIYPFEPARHWIETNLYHLTRQMAGGNELPGMVTGPPVPAEDDEPVGDTSWRADLSSRYVPPGSDKERALVAVWEEFFGATPIGLQDDFFELGGDSLKAMNLSANIRTALDTEVPVKEFFTRLTISGLLEYISENTGNVDELIPVSVEQKEFYPVSSGQRRLFVLHQMGERGTGYNEPVVVELSGPLNLEKVENAFRLMMQRHESLRTDFRLHGGEPVQLIRDADTISFSAELCEAGGNLDAAVNGLIRPFQLDTAPLFRVGVVKKSENRHVLVVDIHHIITDGTSQGIMVAEFMALYNDQPLPEVHLQYRDFSHWQNELIRTGQMARQEEFWLKEFETEPDELELPLDYPRPPFLSFEGGRIQDNLGAGEINALKTIASNHDGTLYMVFLAMFDVLLAKISGKQDIVCGTLIAGRKYAEFQDIPGMFVNTLALRHQVEPQASFAQFLGAVRQKTLEIYENQDYQFETLVDKIVRTRDTSRNPLFDVMFIFQNYHIPSLQIPGLELKPFQREISTTKFDLRLDCIEHEEGMNLKLEYSTRLFKDETVHRILTYFKRIIGAVSENPGKTIAEIAILTPDEQEALLVRFNETGAEYPHRETLHRLFEKQVERLPGHPAVKGKQPLSYRELNRAAQQVAQMLREKSIGHGCIVGLKLKGSIEAVAAILGVLKTGAAYLPIDPDYPEDRIRFMKDDSAAADIIDDSDLSSLQLFRPDRGEPPVLTSPPDPVPPDSPCYVIYTSGSTGNPKGVVLEHRNVVNYICWAIKHYVNDDAVDFPLFTSLSFDLTVTSIFTPLLSGNCIVVYEGEGKEALIQKVIEDNRVGVVKLTPSHLKLILETTGEPVDSRIQRFILGGEALETATAAEIHRLFKGKATLYNEYGPTETAVGCMIYPFSPETDKRQTVPIGVPADNTGIYILDRHLKPVPVGVAGELYISGHGVARGYLNRPELTADRFVDLDNSDGFSRSYKTGDRARFISEGNIEFLGRLDEQVKIRGFRIEPGEIQGKLREFRVHEPVTAGGIAALKGAGDHQTLCRRCLLPRNYPGIHFDREGVCSVCRHFDERREKAMSYFKTEADFMRSMEETQKSTNSPYDCLLLYSGGKDSTYVLYRLVEMGFNVLTFTFDNGYISDAAFENIKRTTQALQVENMVTSAPHMSNAFVESLNTTHGVCSGCWNALNAYGAKAAARKGINLVVSGLSRGQIVEMRLEGLLEQDIFDEDEIDAHLKLFRKSFHSKSSSKYARLLDVDLEEEVIDNTRFVDFFRYKEIPSAEVLAYLTAKGWQRPGDTGFCSSNCLINDVGIYTHLKQSGYHFYAAQTSWDIRMGVLPREQGLREMGFEGDEQTVERILEEIGYYSPPIKDAVVLDQPGAGGDTALAAYIVSDDELLAPELRQFLAGQLPDYMIPSDFIQVDRIPLTPNGKIDRKALAALGKKLDTGVQYVAPQSGKELQIAGIWKEVLQLDSVGINDNFFDLGGTSVDIIRVNSRLREMLQQDIPILTMYKHTTIASLARLWDSGSSDGNTTGTRKQERAGKIEKGRTQRRIRQEKKTRRKR